MSGISDFLSGFKKGFREFGMQISEIINKILLSMVYITGVGPISLIYRLSGRHFLRLGKKDESYYVQRKTGEATKDDFLRQF